MQLTLLAHLDQQPHCVVVLLHAAEPLQQLTVAEVGDAFAPVGRQCDTELLGCRANRFREAVRLGECNRGALLDRLGQRRIVREPASDFRRAPAQRRIAQQQPAQQLAHVAILDGVDIDVARRQLMQDHRIGKPREWMHAACRFEHDHAERPVVGLAVDDARQTFRRCVGQGARDAGEALRPLEHRRDAEVGQHELERLQRPDEHVLGL